MLEADIDTLRSKDYLWIAFLVIITGVVLGSFWLANPLFSLGFIALAALMLAIFSDLFYGFVLLLVASQFDSYKFSVGSFNVRVEQVVVLLLGIFWLTAFLRNKICWHKTAFNKALAALIFVSFLSSFLFSPDKAQSYQGVLLLIVYVSMFLLTVNILIEYPQKIKQAIIIFVGIGVIHAVWALIAWISFKGGFYLGGISPGNYGALSIPATRGFLQESDLMGAFQAMVILMILAHFINQKRTGLGKPQTLALILLPTMLVIVTSMARAAWIGLVVGLILLIFLLRPPRNIVNPKTLALIVAIIMFSLFIIFPLVNVVMSQVSGSQNALLGRITDLLNFQTGSGAGRVRVEAVALSDWTQSPWLGLGLWSLRGSNLPQDHWIYSTFVQSLHDSGVIGALLLLWIQLGVAGLCLASVKKTDDPFLKSSLVGFGVGTVALTIASQASSFFWNGFPWLYLGIAVATMKIARSGNKEGHKLPQKWNKAIQSDG